MEFIQLFFSLERTSLYRVKSKQCLIFFLKVHSKKKSFQSLNEKEMKVLELNRKLLELLGVCPESSNNLSNWHKINFIVVLLLQILGLVSSIWFIIMYLTTDLNSVLYAGFHTSAYSSSTYSLLVGFMVQHKIFETFKKLQDIYDEREFFWLYFVPFHSKVDILAL